MEENTNIEEYKAAAEALNMDTADMQDYMSLMKDAKFRELMDKIEEENRAQAEYAKKQYTMSKIGAFASIAGLAVIVITVLVLVPQIIMLIQNVNGMIAQANQLITQGNQVITEINNIKLIEQLSSAVTELQSGVSKLNQIDIDGLNSAINDLAAVVEPLAKLFGRR